MKKRVSRAHRADQSSTAVADKDLSTRHRFTLRQLEAFVEVARLGSASAAASSLSRTQSAISMAMQELESALGCELFERHGRRLVRTKVAESLLPRAIEMVDRASEIAELVSAGAYPQTQLTLGASRTVGPFVMPDLLRRCSQEIPGLQVNLTVVNSEELIRRIHRFELDCAFIEGDVLDPTLEKKAWLDDELCVIARSGHPVFKSRKALEQRLADSAWVLREPGSGSRELFLRAIVPLIPQPTVALELDDPEAQKRCIRNSDWLSCISRRAIQDELDNGELCEVPGLSAGLKKALSRRFWIVTHRERFQTDALRQVLVIAMQMKRENS